jgi:MYXO-CTERM domain-containing protein
MVINTLKYIAVALIAAIGLLTAECAIASIYDGKTVDYVELFDNDLNGLTLPSDIYSGPTPVLVGAGIEVPSGISGRISVDISDASIVVTFLQNQLFTSSSFNGFGILDSALVVPSITNFTVAGNTITGGFDSGRATFDADRLFVNLESLNVKIGDTVSFSITASANTGTPEPASLAIWGLGALGLAAVGRARRRKA